MNRKVLWRLVEPWMYQRLSFLKCCTNPRKINNEVNRNTVPITEGKLWPNHCVVGRVSSRGEGGVTVPIWPSSSPVDLVDCSVASERWVGRRRRRGRATMSSGPPKPETAILVLFHHEVLDRCQPPPPPPPRPALTGSALGCWTGQLQRERGESASRERPSRERSAGGACPVPWLGRATGDCTGPGPAQPAECWSAEALRPPPVQAATTQAQQILPWEALPLRRAAPAVDDDRSVSWHNHGKGRMPSLYRQCYSLDAH